MPQNKNGEIRVSIGDTLRFVYGDEDGTGYAPKYYQVRQKDGTLLTTGDSGNTYGPLNTTVRTIAALNDSWGANIYVTDDADDYTVATASFTAGDVGFVLLMDTSLGAVYHMIPLRIDYEKEISTSTKYIATTEPSDASLESIPNTLIGRVWTLEKNQRDVLMPRLKRTLGLLGENQLVDGFVYDDDGNITECRVRIFDSITNRDAASIWSDRINDADPASSLESGEIARYTTSVSNLLPRNLRTVYQQEISIEASDSAYGDLGTSGGSIV